MSKSKVKNFVKVSAEAFPSIIFFILYYFYNINYATIAVTIATLISTPITFFIEKKISYFPLLSCLMLLIFGSISIYTGDSTYIKMKITVFYSVFFIILITGVFFNKGFLKYIIGSSAKMSDKNWVEFSKRWAIFFLFIAILNEIVWRNFSDNIWVIFKVFGTITLTLIFLLFQLPFMKKNQKN